MLKITMLGGDTEVISIVHQWFVAGMRPAGKPSTDKLENTQHRPSCEFTLDCMRHGRSDKPTEA